MGELDKLLRLIRWIITAALIGAALYCVVMGGFLAAAWWSERHETAADAGGFDPDEYLRDKYRDLGFVPDPSGRLDLRPISPDAGPYKGWKLEKR